MKRIFYTSYQPYILEYAKLMREESGWEPVFWFIQGNFSLKLNEVFPNVLTYDYFDAIKGKLPSFLLEQDLVATDAEFLKSMAYEESVALNMMSRNSLDVPLFYQDRVRLYLRLVRLSLTLLEKLKPDIIIFEETPHQACDYILYQVARKKGVKTILFETSLFLRYILPMHSYENGYIKMIDAYKNACKSEILPEFFLSEYAMEEINKKKGDYSKGIPFYMIDQQKEFNRANTGLLRKYITLPFKLLNLPKLRKRLKFLLSLNKPALHNYFKQKDTSFENSRITNWEYLIGVNKIKKVKKNLLQYYKSVETKNPDLTADYIFCPLHYQPEKTSSPWGGYYVNQLLMIQVLSKAVPKGWKIYVKEHLSQYVFPETGEAYRDKMFYADIKKLGNVELIPVELKSFDLIDKAKAVASVSGSVLWESVLRGKPAMAFGEGHHSWCGGCEGIFYTPDNESVKKVIAQINSGYEVDQRKTLLYAHFIEKYGFKGYAGGNAQAIYSGISAEQNALLHVKATKELLTA